MVFAFLFLTLVSPLALVCVRVNRGFKVEVARLADSLQWFRDPYMYRGLAELIPFLGVILFLCIIRVVLLCGQQKQCLGGQGLEFTKRSYV